MKKFWLVCLLVMCFSLWSVSGALAYDYACVDVLPDDLVMESRGIYVFEANISDNVQFSNPAPRLLRSAVQYPNDSSDVWTSRQISFSSDDNMYLYSDSTNYEFQVTAVAGQTDGGNQGYTICSVGSGKYLNVKQDLQPASNDPTIVRK